MWRAVGRWACGLVGQRTVAYAHSGTHSYLFLFVDHGRLYGTVQFPAAALDGVLEIAVSDRLSAGGSIDEVIDATEAYASEHARVGASPSELWTLTYTGHRLLEDNGTYVILDYEIRDHDRPIPDRVLVTFDGIVESDPHHQAKVIVHHQVGLGSLWIRTTDTFDVHSGSTRLWIPIDPGSRRSDVMGAGKAMVSRVVRMSRRVRARVRPSGSTA